MARFSIPYLKMRDGRPRWEPGPALRRAGWKGQDLKRDDGSWMSEGDAMIAARALNDEVAQWRATGKRRRRPVAPARHPHSCAALFAQWYSSSDFQRLAAKTQADYKMKAGVFLETFGDAHVRAVTKPHLVAAWEIWHDERGHHMANGIRAVASSALSYAELIGWRTENSNPAMRMKRPKPAARVVLFLPEEISALVTASDELALPDVGDGVVIGLHSGQRLADVLAMPPGLFDEDRIRLSQFKTRALIDAPMTPACLARVRDIRSRQRQAAVTSIATLIINPRTGQPHTGSSFNKHFRKVRERAARLVPSLATKRFQDLRDTAVTRLALAGCTMPEIAAITGHSLPSITQVMRHYLALQPAMADAAIDKLTTWMSDNDIAI